MLMSAIGTFIPVFKGGSNLPSIIVAIIFCWALTFLVNNGVEGASVMGSRAKSLKEAQQATMLGFVLLLVFYMMISILPYGSLTRAQLASAAQPALGNDLKMIVGDWGMMIINIGLIISTIVSWLSWTMLPAETMLLIAEDGAAPKFWGKLSYLFVGLYQMKFSREHKEWTQWTYGLLAALFQFMCMILAGWQSVLAVSLSYIPGLIVYYQGVREQGRKLNKNEKITFIFIAILCVLSIVLIANKKINIM